MRSGLIFLVLGVLVACSQSRVRRYEELIEPQLGKANKDEMSRLLGAKPTKCEKVKLYEQCEYRTARERNDPVPGEYSTGLAGSPDLKPFAYFDVIHLYYDETEVLREWSPVKVAQ